MNNNFSIKSVFRKGFTLIEMLIYLGLFVVLSSVTAMLFTQVVQLSSVSQARSQLAWQAEKVFLEMGNTVRMAEVIDSPVLGGNGGLLSLNFGQVQYQLVDGLLQRVEGGEVENMTSSPLLVEDLAFANYSSEENPGVRVSFVMRLPPPLPYLEEIAEEFQTSMFIRH